MGIKEKFNLEMKRELTKAFLKTVSAYANYNDGEIKFGIDDKGDLVGVENADNVCLKIEHMINDSIEPTPHFYIEVEKVDNKNIIILTIKKGKDTPYYYQGKAYKRSDISTLEVDRFELRRLASEGLNLNYEEKKANSQSLTFSILESKLREKAGIDKLSLDILKTLNLYDIEGYYNIAGELLADDNNIEFSGIDVVRFGNDINQILYRETINKKSLLYQYDRVIEIFEQYYQYEEIKGFSRIKRQLIPREAFREAVANAMVHRVWDTNSYIKISMYDDRIEVKSPGELPMGISDEDYLYGDISVLRNPIIAGVFFRLKIIEQFGTGIRRINKEYTYSISKPSFDIGRNSIGISLPVMKYNELNLSIDEVEVYNLLRNEVELSRVEIDKTTGFNKAKTLRILNNLVEKSIIDKLGEGPGTTYKIK